MDTRPPEAGARIATEAPVAAATRELLATSLAGAGAPTATPAAPDLHAGARAAATLSALSTDHAEETTPAPVTIAIPGVPVARSPRDTAPDNLLEVPDGLKAASDDFFAGIKRRVERRP